MAANSSYSSEDESLDEHGGFLSTEEYNYAATDLTAISNNLNAVSKMKRIVMLNKIVPHMTTTTYITTLQDCDWDIDQAIRLLNDCHP